jgi:quercetin dioxygenase-like cupin family protein
MHKSIVIAAIATLVAANAAFAQQPAPAAPASGIKRTLLQKVEIPGTNFETVLALAEVAPNASSGRHTHPGPETGTVTEGEMLLLVDGQPDRTLKTGDSYQIPAGTSHDVKAGGMGLKVVAAYMVPKGAPLATPAPAK